MGISCSPDRPPSSNATCRLGCSLMRSTSTSRVCEPDRLEALDDDIRNGLASVFPSLSALATSQGERYSDTSGTAAIAPFARLLERLTGTRPLVLVLDDVHWADSASVDLLGSLLRRPPDAAVLLVLALRPRQAPERLAAALEPARRAGSLARLELDALTRERSGRAARVDRRRGDGGHPVRGQRRKPLLPRAARESGQSRVIARADCRVARARLATWTYHPWSPRRWRTSSTCCRTSRVSLLRGAAVAGDPFDPELATAAAAVDGIVGVRRHRRAASPRRDS